MQVDLKDPELKAAYSILHDEANPAREVGTPGAEVTTGKLYLKRHGKLKMNALLLQLLIGMQITAVTGQKQLIIYV